MLRVLLLLVPLALAVYALVDCISSKDEEIRHLPKLVWILLIVLATVVGPLAWLFVGRDRAARRAARGRDWVAPDDNPEFLRSLGEGRARPADGGAREADEELLKDWENDLRRREEELRQQESRDRTDRGDGGRDGDDGAGPSDAAPPGTP